MDECLRGRFLPVLCALIVGACLFPARASSESSAVESSTASEGISIDWYHTDVRDAIKFLSQKAQLSIAFSPAVTGRINYVKLTEVPAQEALALLLKSQGLRLDRSGQMYTVLTNEEFVARHGDKAEVALPKTSPRSSGTTSSQQSISADIKGMDITDVIRYVSQQGDLDVIVDPDVTGLATVQVTNIPAGDVLEALAKSHGFAIERHGSIYRVTTMRSPS
jgi:type II secretory pathway component HofQ